MYGVLIIRAAALLVAVIVAIVGIIARATQKKDGNLAPADVATRSVSTLAVSGTRSGQKCCLSACGENVPSEAEARLSDCGTDEDERMLQPQMRGQVAERVLLAFEHTVALSHRLMTTASEPQWR